MPAYPPQELTHQLHHNPLVAVKQFYLNVNFNPLKIKKKRTEKDRK